MLFCTSYYRNICPFGPLPLLHNHLCLVSILQAAPTSFGFGASPAFGQSAVSFIADTGYNCLFACLPGEMHLSCGDVSVDYVLLAASIWSPVRAGFWCTILCCLWSSVRPCFWRYPCFWRWGWGLWWRRCIWGKACIWCLITSLWCQCNLNSSFWPNSWWLWSRNSAFWPDR